MGKSSQKYRIARTLLLNSQILTFEAAAIYAAIYFRWQMGDRFPRRMWVEIYKHRIGNAHEFLDELERWGYIRTAAGDVVFLTNPRLKVQREAISKTLRRRVYERDGFRCVYCSAIEFLVCDHVTPVVQGGATSFRNLVTACFSCNSAKGGRTVSEWKRARG